MEGRPKIRIKTMDRLRSLVILLVIVHHSIIPYAENGLPWWYVQDSGKIVWFDIAILLNDTFMMQALFFVAGFFFIRTSTGDGDRFLAAKAKRLLIPLAAGMVFLGPVIAYVRALNQGYGGENYFIYWIYNYLPHGIEQFHFWFLGVLFVFFIASWICKRLLVRSAAPLWQHFSGKIGTMSIPGLYGYAALMGLLTAFMATLAPFDNWVNFYNILVFQPTRLPIYAGFFLLGAAAATAGWELKAGNLPRLSIVAPVALLFCVVLVAIRAGALSIPMGQMYFLAGVFYPLTGISLFILLLHLALALDKHRQRYYVSQASYEMYLFHLPIVVMLQFLLVDLILNQWLKAIVVTGIAITISYFLAHLMIRIIGMISTVRS